MVISALTWSLSTSPTLPALQYPCGKPLPKNMGSAFSPVSSGTVLTILVVAVGLAYLFYTGQIGEHPPGSGLALPKEKSKHSRSLKKSKKKRAVTKEVVTSAAEEDVKLPRSEPSTSSGAKSKLDEQKPTVIPGGFASDATASAVEHDTDAGGSGKPKKKKKGKSKKAGREGTGSSAQVEEKSDAADPAEFSSLGRSAGGAGLDPETWTRVESRRKPKSQPMDPKSGPQDGSCDAGITTSVTDNSFPATGDEAGPTRQPGASSASQENRRTFAEKLIPKPCKTGVEAQ